MAPAAVVAVPASTEAVVTATTFGPEFSRALRDICSDLAPHTPPGVAPRWVLKVFGYEGKLNPATVNHLGYSGLWQKSPTWVDDPTRPNGRRRVLYIEGPGKLNPAVQCRDYGAFTLANMKATFAVGGKKFRLGRATSLAQFYCLNLAPARASCRVVYAHPKAPWKPEYVTDPELAEEIRFAQHWWPTAYGTQHEKLDPQRKGWIGIDDLEAPINEAAETVLKVRIEAELAALLAVDAK